MRPRRLAGVAAAAFAAAALAAGDAVADSTPVGPLPAGPRVAVAATRGALVAIALPRKSPASGLVWRLARPIDPPVVREVSEGEVGATVVVVFRVVGPGAVDVHFALTRGDSSSKALASRTAHISST